MNNVYNRTAEHFFPNGILVERFCEADNGCNVDQHSFKGYMHRSLAVVSQLVPELRDSVLALMRSSTEGAISSCQADGTCGFKWTVGEFDGDMGHGPAGQQMSALAAVMTMMLLPEHEDVVDIPPPFTNKTGGESQGNPNAGQNPDHILQPLRPLTMGDRVGSGVLTGAIVTSFLAGIIWMALPLSER